MKLENVCDSSPADKPVSTFENVLYITDLTICHNDATIAVINYEINIF